MHWTTFRRPLIIVLVPFGILIASIALSLAFVYCASLLNAPASQLKPLMFLNFFIALILFAKVGGWLLSSLADVTQGWIEALVSALLAPACSLVVISIADRHGFATWMIAALAVPAWIAGVVFARRFVRLLDKALAPLRPATEA